MLTLKEHPDNTFLAWLYENGKRKHKIFYHPHKELSLRMSVDSLDSFNSERFRDKFKLSQNQTVEILGHLKKKTTPEGALQTKFFRVKKYLEESLFHEMNVSGTNQKIMVDFPDNGEWAATMLVCAGSGNGKTWFLKEMCKRCMLGKAKNKRNFLWISNELEIDKTIKELKKPRFQKHFRGIDISDGAFENSEAQTPEEFYKKEVAPAIDNVPESGVIIVDDAADSVIHRQMRKKINKLLRTGRHTNRGLCYILHAIKAGLDSTQASSSCRYYVLFPKSAKGKIVDYLRDQGLTMSEARQQVSDFSDCKSRAMIVRLHAPTALINEELLRLF
jgi:hypothetical protein